MANLKKNIVNFRVVILITLLFFIGFMSFEQENKKILSELKEDEHKVVEAIALYPQEQREAILLAAAHPEILVRMQNIREKTERQFQDILEELPEDDQKNLYSLTRYPEVIAKIAIPPERKTQKELDGILEGYPEDVKEAADAENTDC